ncbi:MAG: hypothetical protein MI976_09035 [Pseudomonadales bacterium]|nr:hypothetical protein [Pseudomonadales bacterium]
MDIRPQAILANDNPSPLALFSFGFPALFMLLGLASPVSADLDSELGFQVRGFTENSPEVSGDMSSALRYQLTYNTSWNDGADTFEFIPWFIWDSEDSERRHGDIQDLAWFHVADTWELRTGIRKVFWGVVESQHRVDIINQTDLARNPNGEEKLGQPMINLSLVRDWGILDIYLLVGHRERIFPGEQARFQSRSLPVEWDRAGYAHPDEENHVDAAFRWQHYYGDWEWALSHFSGASRDPILSEEQTLNGREVIIPLYTTIDQTGLEVQYIWGSWIFKGEFISNSGIDDRFTAGTIGFEYTQVGLMETVYDLGWIVEYSADDRGDEAVSLAEHDFFLGGRLSLNDADSSEIVMGVNLDSETDEQLYVLEASKRVAESVKLVIDAFIITGPENGGLNADFSNDYKTQPIRRDDYVQVEAVYYF